MRVALCFGTYPPERNGGADFLGRFAAALAAGGTEVVVLTSPAEGASAEERRDGLAVHRAVTDWGLGADGRGVLRRVNAILRDEGVDLVHVVFPDSVIQARYQLPAAIGAGRLPLVTTFWGLGLGRRSPNALRLEALALLARSRAVTSHDPGYLAFLRRTVGRGRPVHWLPVGSNVVGPTPPAAFRPHPEPFRLAYFGQLDPTRGVEDLMEAVRLVRSAHDVRLVMLGSAGRRERYDADPDSGRYLRRLLGLPARLGVDDCVEWTEWLSDEDVAQRLADSDLCVLPYRRISLGRSALAAALEAGCPTVLCGTEDGVAPLRPDVHVALSPPRDAVALASTIERLLGDAAARRRLAAGARRAAHLFSWPRIAAGACSVYRQVLGSA